MAKKKTVKKAATKKAIMPKSTKSVFGLDQNAAAALSYAFVWASALVVLMLEKKNDYVRFHAMQSLLLFAGLNIAMFVPIVGWLLSPFLMILGFVLWLTSIYKAYNGEMFELPIVGKIAKEKAKALK